MDVRIDLHPTHNVAGHAIRAGQALPFGATVLPGGAVNFSVFSRHATDCTLVLFRKGERDPFAEIPFPREFRIGNVYAVLVFGLDREETEYGYRMDGPNEPAQGHRFDRSRVLLDPYAKAIGGRDVWRKPPDWSDPFQHRSRLVFDDFDWEDDHPLELPLEELVIYELHVRSFTAHPSAGVSAAGTFAGLVEKIPYLKKLGVNCVELMPVFEFDEFENSRVLPETGELLVNYWGYSTVGFFAPKAGYARTGVFGMEADEFKTMVREFHRNGIEVMLDVVFNHTAEGNERGPSISFRGIDNRTYYMLSPEGHYMNFSGCGNTVNCNNPVVRGMVLDCLRYWAAEYHIDGFRFDLASILGRDPWGAPMSNPPLIEQLAFDPILARCKLVAEAWDPGGLYQVGSFPAYGRWAEWNGKYRDATRKFLKGEMGLAGDMAQRVQGSPDLYASAGRGAAISVNFITAHDGFTLRDLFSYNQKRNLANGEGNNDGANDNESWNCGCEGETEDAQVNALRRRMIKNALALLFVSRGTPMLLMGDELGRTQQGNNNTYCHDSELNWVNWELDDSQQEILRFARNCISFRRAHPVLRGRAHFQNRDCVGSGVPDISWHGTRAWSADWSGTSRVLAFMLCGRHTDAPAPEDNTLYVAFNMHWQWLEFELPAPPAGSSWHVFANTGAPAPEDSWEPGTEPLLADQHRIGLEGRSTLILIAKIS
jgi:glycogen operon protein